MVLKCFSLSVHGLGLPFDSSHNSADAFRRRGGAASYIQLSAGRLPLNEFRLNLETHSAACVSGLHISETTGSVFMQRMRIFSAASSFCITNLLLLQQINGCGSESYASKL